MDNSISKFIPLIFITLFCLASVEGGYLAIEHYLLKPPAKLEMETKTQKQTVREQGRVRPPKKDLKIIVKRQLFGAPASEQPVVKEPVKDEENIAASTLDVVLMGTVKSDNDGNRAIILDKATRKQQIYGVGDAIEGALIEKILRGKVILVANGKNEILDMSKAAEERSTYSRVRSSALGSAKQVRPRPQRKINVRKRTPVRKRVVARPQRSTSIK